MSLFIAMLLSAFSFAPDDASERYLDCLTLIESDFEMGRRAAQIWTDEGGGANAQHCLALADIAADFPKLGAARLEGIAQRKDAGDDLVRARLYAQAAEAWLSANETRMAEGAIKAAFEHAPDAGELHLTAAMVHAAGRRHQQVVAAITAAEQAGFISVRGFILRGRANLTLGDTEAAAHDTVAALSLQPTNVDALTLRGDVQRAGIVIDVDLRSVAPTGETGTP